MSGRSETAALLSILDLQYTKSGGGIRVRTAIAAAKLRAVVLAESWTIYLLERSKQGSLSPVKAEHHRLMATW